MISPLCEAGLTKKDIRRLSRKLKLPTWDKPALACLASRIPYHSRITRPRLRRIEKAEEMLRRIFKIRGNLRDFGDVARIEVDKDEIRKFLKEGPGALSLKRFGYRESYVDPGGYRTGSLNEGIRTR